MKFSQLYLPPSELIRESAKMRKRIGNYTLSISLEHNINDYLTQKIEQECGVSVPRDIACFNFETMFESISITECLDSLTVIYEALKEHLSKHRPRRSNLDEDFKSFVNKVFKEEGLAYIMTDDGSVKFNPDEEFEANRTLTLNNLSDKTYGAALAAFNHAYDDFHANPPRYKSALRNIFEANEVVFKQMTNTDRLTSFNIKNHNSIFLSATNDSTSKNAQEKIIESYKSWVDALHNYRHGQNVEVYDEPTLEFTTLAISNGAAYLRWLVSIAKSTP